MLLQAHKVQHWMIFLIMKQRRNCASLNCFVFADCNKKCGADRPLNEEESRCIIKNFDKLLDALLTSHEFTACLFARDVINDRHRQYITASVTVYEANKKLLKIMMRRSYAQFIGFLRCLFENNQEHIAKQIFGEAFPGKYLGMHLHCTYMFNFLSLLVTG